jgi:hypothetical protein
MLGHRLHRAGPIKVDPVSFRGEIHFLDIDEPEALELVKQGLADADPDWQQFIFLTEPH